MEIQVGHQVFADVLVAGQFAVAALAHADALDLVQPGVVAGDRQHPRAGLGDVRMRCLERRHRRVDVLDRLPRAPLGEPARLVAGEGDLRTQRQHVGRQSFIDQVAIRQVGFADLQQVRQGVEPGHEDVLELLEPDAGHGGLPGWDI